jgi:hypothetical protein
MARLILLVVVVAAGLWLYKHSSGGLLGSREKESASSDPIERARQAAHAAEGRQAQVDRLDSQPTPRETGWVQENMTPPEVRALLGAPDEITTGTTPSGAPRETWFYRNVGKKVVFENGIAVSVE